MCLTATETMDKLPNMLINILLFLLFYISRNANYHQLEFVFSTPRHFGHIINHGGQKSIANTLYLRWRWFGMGALFCHRLTSLIQRDIGMT